MSGSVVLQLPPSVLGRGGGGGFRQDSGDKRNWFAPTRIQVPVTAACGLHMRQECLK